MMIIRKANMDFLTGGHPVLVNAVENDRYVRALELTLTDGGVPWTVPEDARVLVSYSRPDGSCGCYDTLPNGETAWTAEGNVLSVVLAPQLMAVPGPVNVWISLIRGQEQLSTYAVVLKVLPCPVETSGEEGGAVNVTGFLPGVAGAAVGQFLRVTGVDGNGLVTEMEPVDLEAAVLLKGPQKLTQAQQKQVRDNIGAAAAENVLQTVTEADSGKLLQVINGAWSVVSVGESAVKTFLEDFIRSALEGDY